MRVTRAWLHKEPAQEGGCLASPYDYRNRLTEVKQGGTLIATYTYNALDQRIGIQDSGGSTTWTIYNGASADALPYADFNGSGGALLTRYVSGPGMVNGAVVDELLARTSSGGTTAWYLTDKLDSVRDVVSSAGSVLDHVVYDSFGNITTETNSSNGDRFKFAGMEYDSVAAQDYDRARNFSPSTGRFTSPDPLGFVGADNNLYRYAKDEPTLYVDPTGLVAIVSRGADEPVGPPGPVLPVPFELPVRGHTYNEWQMFDYEKYLRDLATTQKGYVKNYAAQIEKLMQETASWDRVAQLFQLVAKAVYFKSLAAEYERQPTSGNFRSTRRSSKMHCGGGSSSSSSSSRTDCT